jgi:hypothetical protein
MAIAARKEAAFELGKLAPSTIPYPSLQTGYYCFFFQRGNIPYRRNKRG